MEKRRRMKYKIKITAILVSVIAGGALVRPAFADTPKQLTKILTSPNIQLKADPNVDKGAIDDRWYSFGMDFDIQEKVNPGDYFFIYQKGIAGMGEVRDFDIKANGKTVATAKVVESNKGRGFYSAYKTDAAGIAKFDAYTVDEAVPWSKWKITFNQDIAGQNVNKIGFNFSNIHASYPIANVTFYDVRTFATVNDREVFSKNIKVRAYDEKISYADTIWRGSSNFDSATKKGLLQFGIKTKSDWKDANIKIELEKDSPVVFSKEKAERNTGSNFIFDDNNRINADKLIMEYPRTGFKFGFDSEGLLGNVKVLQQQNLKSSSGFYLPVELNSDPAAQANIDLVNGKLKNIKLKVTVTAKDGSIIFQGDTNHEMLIRGILTQADLEAIKPKPTEPAKEAEAKTEKPAEAPRGETAPKTPQTGFNKSENNDAFGWIILASAILMTLTSGVVIYRKKSKINL